MVIRSYPSYAVGSAIMPLSGYGEPIRPVPRVTPSRQMDYVATNWNWIRNALAPNGIVMNGLQTQDRVDGLRTQHQISGFNQARIASAAQMKYQQAAAAIVQSLREPPIWA
jgi:hypothetical protein